MTVALIDADIVAYTVAAACQSVPSDWPGAEEPADETPTFSEDDVRRGIDAMLDDWTDRASCTSRVVLLTGSGNFRKLVSPTYKSNRSKTARPVALGFARDYLVREHGGRLVDGLEADDLIGLALTGPYADGKGVAVSVDKDMLTLPGTHFNPRKDDAPHEVSSLDADIYWMTQTLTGDSTDGYPGCPGVGPKKAVGVVGGRFTLSNLWGAVVHTYGTKKLTADDALRQARLARILRRGEYDKTTQEVLLWKPDGYDRLSIAQMAASKTPDSPTS